MITTSEKATQNGADSPLLKSSHLSRIERADERTRTADLLQLRVCCYRVRLVPSSVARVGISVGINHSSSSAHEQSSWRVFAAGRLRSLLPTTQDIERDVQDDGSDAACGDTAVEHDLHSRWETGVEILDGHRDDPHSEADGHDDDVRVPLEVDPREVPDPGGCDGAEQREPRAAEYGERDRSHHGSKLGEEPQQDQEDPRRCDNPAALDASEAHKPYVLGVRRVGEGVQDPTERGGQTIRTQPRGQVVLLDPLVHDLAHRDSVSGGLYHRHQHDEDHGQDGRELKGRQTEEKGRGDAEGGRFSDPAEVGHPDDRGDNGADDQAEEHRDLADKAAEETVDDEDDEQDREGEGDVAGAAELLGAGVPATRPGDRHRQERDADYGDDGAGYNGREKA